MPNFELKKTQQLLACFDHTLPVERQIGCQVSCPLQALFRRGFPVLIVLHALCLWLLYTQGTACHGI